MSVVPLDTELVASGASTQSSCNKDFTCSEGFCPSFVTVHGAKPRRAAAGGQVPAHLRELPEPSAPSLEERPYGILVTGIGGTGVVTVGAMITMAAHLEGRACSSVDQFGMAQKGRGGHLAPAPRRTGGGHPRGAPQRGRRRPPVRLRRARRGQRPRARHDCKGAHPSDRQPARGDHRALRSRSRHGVSAPEHRRATSRRRRGRGRSISSTPPHRHRAHGRLHRHQPLHARIRVAEGPGSGERGRDRACDRAERGGGGEQPGDLPVGAPGRGGPRGGQRPPGAGERSAGTGRPGGRRRGADGASCGGPRPLPDRAYADRYRALVAEARHAESRRRRAGTASRRPWRATPTS